MPYTQVQFIAYQIDTSPANVKWNVNDVMVQGTYPGLASNQLDVQARCELMLRAMQTARDNLLPSSPPEAPGTTLKVLLAPEFFFRGSQGAYPMEDVQLAIEILQRTVSDDQWSDWVFGFGSILGVSAPAVGSPPTIDPNAVKEVYNFTLIQKGGVASQGHTGARVVMKELKSGIDFIAQNANPGGLLIGDVEHTVAGAKGPGNEQQRVNYDGAGIFDLDGITWGVEICLDHLGSVKRLQKSPQLPGENQVQIQLVPSGGMSIQDASIIAAPGGYVFNCDGMNGGRSRLDQVGTPPTIPPLSTHPVDNAPITLNEVSPVQDVAVTQLFKGNAGRIVTYPVKALPPASKVQGSIVTLDWALGADYRIKFDLVYDENGDYKTLLCQPSSTKTSFSLYNYFLPLVLTTYSKEMLAVKALNDKRSPPAPTDPDVKIKIDVTGAANGFDHGVLCHIDLPDFDFQGVAFLFNDTVAKPAPKTSW
ncbi:hypothetical protein ENSA5_62070 [Enhygromyxa salina]|uniref:Uncharacterized protein n=1 Tax=Enhygromyxa salina TaxID=215803 RepID=A0A2S9XD40_9BACT|nr:hypothetical protein [Enhygromyxa salina]PRP90773.1 hypothetical protein ENSA5_62070 [Enhygromyxa salina]